MQKPWIAATVGQRSAASCWNACGPRRIESPIVPLASNSANSRMSAPAMKPLALPERSTSPFGGSSASRSSSASSSISTSWAKVLTDSPARSNVSTTMPSSRCSACQWLKRSPSSPAIMGMVRYGAWGGRYHPDDVRSASNRRLKRPSGRHGLWQAPPGPRSSTMPPRNFPSHAHVTTSSREAGPPGSTGPMAEVVDTQQGQDLDQELVRRVQRGDSAAFDLLVRKYQHRIAALIGRYISDWSECQDVAQDTFIRAYRAIGNFRGDAQFYTWLHR